MTAQNSRSGAESEGCPEIFDRAHLSHYTMHSAELEREILGLFLQQVPLTVTAITGSHTPEDWKLATHTLKGSCAAIGAWRIHNIAKDLETLGFEGDPKIRDLRLQLLQAAVAEFREVVTHIHP